MNMDMDNKVDDKQNMGYGVGMPSMPGQYMSAGMGGAPMMGYPQGMGGYPAQQPMMPPMASMASFKLPPVNSGGSPTPGAATGKNGGARFKKAPDAPKRFKSAFIIFSAEKHKDIKEHLATQGRTEKTTDIAKLVSEAWREMPAEEKEMWEEKARQDKARYEVEKAMYKGPWKIPANKRTPKDPTAPKRPMSAFLAFSNKRRAALKRQHPDATNADLSKMLSKTWKEAPMEMKSKYMEEEAELRAKYKVEMAKWRKRVAEEKKQERKEREALAMQEAESRRTQGPDVTSNAVMQESQNQYMSGQQDMSGQFGMYGNPYGMPTSTAYAPPGSVPGNGSMQGSVQGGQPQFSNMMAGNPFAAQMLGGQSGQQQLLQQLIANQGGGMPMGMQYHQQGMQNHPNMNSNDVMGQQVVMMGGQGMSSGPTTSV